MRLGRAVPRPNCPCSRGINQHQLTSQPLPSWLTSPERSRRHYSPSFQSGRGGQGRKESPRFWKGVSEDSGSPTYDARNLPALGGGTAHTSPLQRVPLPPPTLITPDTPLSFCAQLRVLDCSESTFGGNHVDSNLCYLLPSSFCGALCLASVSSSVKWANPSSHLL